MRKFVITALLFSAFMPAVLSNNVFASPKKTTKPPEQVYMKEKPEAHPPAHAQAQAQDASALSGKIVETMNSGGYTYLCIEKDGKKTWAAVLEMKAAVGDEIALQPGYEMVNFTSKTLNKTFDKIIFSTGPASPQGGDSVKNFHGGAMGSSESKASPGEVIKVEKATGDKAFTVAELYSKSTELDKKNVTVKGKVVKVSSGIMGRNWLHLQDGTGSAEKGNNDLVVTTSELAAVGDVVTASGHLYKDKDFGSGYKYDVIVEQASIEKQ